MSSTLPTASGSSTHGREAVLEQLGEEGARHDHARVNREAEVAQPGFAEDVGGGHALVGTLLDRFKQGHALLQGMQASMKGSRRSSGSARLPRISQTASSKVSCTPWPQNTPLRLKRVTA